MYAADHISAVRRNFESRAMPETEKPPAGPVDIYCIFFLLVIMPIINAIIDGISQQRSLLGGKDSIKFVINGI